VNSAHRTTEVRPALRQR